MYFSNSFIKHPQTENAEKNSRARKCWNSAAGKAEANSQNQQKYQQNKQTKKPTNGYRPTWSKAMFAGCLQHLREKLLPFLKASEINVWRMTAGFSPAWALLARSHSCLSGIRDRGSRSFCVYSHRNQRDSSAQSPDPTTQRKFQTVLIMCAPLASTLSHFTNHC